MSRRKKYITFEGIFAAGVLGIFRVIRGFADLRDLAAVSVPFKMNIENEPERVFGHQRDLDEKHAKDIKTYLERSDNRFIPEVILSLRCDNLEEIRERDEILGIQTPSDSEISIKRRFSGKSHRIQKIRVRCSEIDEIKEAKLIRRIDGNHRLAFAESLEEDTNLKQKYLAPFCVILLGSPEETADDYAESLIFHTINSTALKLKSEHGLRLLLLQDPAYAMTLDNEFAYSPELHLTRLLYEKFQRLWEPARNRFGEQPLTTLGEAAQNMIAMNPNITESRTSLTNFAEDLFAGLADILTRLSASNPSLCQTHAFLDLAARVWWESSGDDHDVKVQHAVEKLERLGKWLGDQGITNLLNPLSPAAQLLETFNAVQSRIPRRLFLARWYPNANSNGEAFSHAELRLQQIRAMLDVIERDHGIRLELIDMGTEEGGTFPIHKKMYEAIASSDIIICDLTGHRPNVYVEAGFALKHHEKNRLIFLFEPTGGNDRVPFDLNTFKYVPISQAAEIPNKVKPEIISILRECGANV
jgi:hypothetical protein